MNRPAFVSMNTTSLLNTNPSALVELRDIRFGYGERVILDGISLTIPRGKVTALMGASGGGKTTVMRLIGGQYRAKWRHSTPPICTPYVVAWACCFSLVRCSPT
jgi:ABC-type bacteriocin/lantibiotic exporter with double-glycine peptidase domain